MNNKLIVNTEINKKNLSKYHYTLSLLQEAKRVGIISNPEIYNIRQQFMFLLKDLILRYTDGKSTSVKIETAEQIQSSLLYALDTRLASLSEPGESVSLLQEKNLKSIYEEGLELLMSTFKETKLLFDKVKENKLKIPLEVYNTSIDEALPDFFSKYDVVFNAQNTMTMLDYPLLFDDMKVEGVFYIKNYLENLNTETQFCKYFSEKEIKKVLINYGRIYDIDYRESHINIFEVLINNCLFSLMLDDYAPDDTDYLKISESKFLLIKEKFTEVMPTEIKNYIKKSVARLIEVFKINKSGLIGYIKKYRSFLTPRVINAEKNDSLQNIIIIEPGERDKNELQEKITFISGNGMSDDRFRLLTDKIRNCPDTRDKIKIITSAVKSLGDLIDILEADCLFDDEFQELYNTLTDVELALLGKVVFQEDAKLNQLNQTERILNKKDVEVEWQQLFIDFIRKLNENRIREIENQIKILDIP